MALPTLSPFTSPLPKLSSSPSPTPSKPPSFLRIPSNNRKLDGIFSTTLQPVSCSFFSGDGDHRNEQTTHSRPPEIPWRKDLANSVQLIGNIGAAVQIKQLGSGKIVAWTRLAFKKSSSETSWINLTFWDELAHVAFEHVEKGNQVYVSGRLVSDTVEGEDEKPQVFYKVVVQQLNFIEKSLPPLMYEQGTGFKNSGLKNESYAGNSFTSSSTEELWQAFFVNPVDWWDNRKTKRNSKYPDFKHKHTGEALWIEGKYNPSWVKSQLAILDEKMGSFQALEASSKDSFTQWQ